MWRAACFRLLILVAIAGTVCVTFAKPQPDSATVTFRRVFKSSFPEFVEIKVSEAGEGTYDIRQLSDEADPEPFQVGAALSHRIFELAAKLHNFDGVNLEINHRIANLGQKTLQYDHGSESHAVTFNYTTDDSASQLQQIFDGLVRQVTDASDLQHAIKYDRLGVNDVLSQIEKDLDAKVLPEPERLVPILAQAAADQHIIDMARTRARSLSARIDAGR
jgi:hypothetical protein